MRRVRAIVAVVVFAVAVLVLFLLSFSTPPLFGIRLTGIVVRVDYPSPGATYFGPAVQSVCTGCPQILDNNAVFVVSFDLTNTGTGTHTISGVSLVVPLAGQSGFRPVNGGISVNVTNTVTSPTPPWSVPPQQTAVLTVKLVAPANRGNYELTLAVAVAK